MIQQLDDNTTAYVGSNDTVIKSKDGKELFIDTSSLTYDAIMSLFKDLPQNGNYFDSSFWEKIMEFLGNFLSDWNMRFAAHKNFWQDFLNDEIDMDGFMEFINGTNKGVPDYSVTVGDSMYINKDKMQWARRFLDNNPEM